MKNLIFLVLLTSSFNIATAQNYCSYFVPDYKYTGTKAFDLKIEFTSENGATVFKISASIKDVPFTLPKASMDFFLKNESKLTINVTNCTLKYIDDANGQSIPTYIYKPSTVEAIQLQSGILGIIYVEPFPGDVINYKPIGGC
jgi:hypothetical protein